jgi:hypothetical protein
MNRIDKKKFMEIVGISSATLTRRLQNEWFIKATGARRERGKTNDVWTFDEQKARQYNAGNASETETAVEEQSQEPQGLIVAGRQTTEIGAPLEPFVGIESIIQNNQIAGAMILLNKRILTIDEAHLLTSLPKAFLIREVSEIIGGRRMIRKSKLDEI